MNRAVCGNRSNVCLPIPSRLGDAAAKRIDQEGLYRTVCDYIAAMTDRYLMAEHARLTS